MCTGLSRAHVRALYEEIHVQLKAAGEHHMPVQGADLGWWIVVDYTDVVVHILQPDARAFYDIDGLYDGCPLLEWTPADAAPPTPGEQAAEV